MRKKKPTLSRKQQRKESRIAKKARRHGYFSTKKFRNQPDKLSENQTEPKYKNNAKCQITETKKKKSKNKGGKNINISLQDEILKELREDTVAIKNLHVEMQKKRVKQLKEDSAADDLELLRLEKQLGLNKRKDKQKSSFFATDGLDYLLDICDRKKIKEAVEAEKRFKEDDEDFGDDLAQVMGAKKAKKKKLSGTDSSSSAKNEGKDAEYIQTNDSDSEPEELLSTKVGSMYPAKKTKDSKKGAGQSNDASNKYIESLPSDEENDEKSDNINDDSDDCFGLNDDDSESDDFDSDLDSELDGNLLDKKDNCKIPNTVSNKEKGKQQAIVKKGLIEHSKKAEKVVVKKGVKRKVEETSNKQKKKLDSRSSKTNSGSSDDNSDMDGTFSEGSELSNYSDSDFGSELDDNDEKPKTKENDEGMWEDIYGRTRDKEGNVVTKYQPPHLRQKTEEEGPHQEKLTRLKKQMKGLLNRLAENNMVSIASQIETLYSNHSRNDMNETLWLLYRESLLGETDTPDRLVAEHALLLAVLGANVGGEVSAHCLQKCVMEWHKLWTAGADVRDKQTNNVLLLLSYMYHFKLFHSTLLYDMLELLLDKLDEKEAELILLVLRTVGFSLRKEDPVRLKEFVLKMQTLANRNDAAAIGTRIKFLLETVMAIKNNNMSKIPNYNPEYAEQLKKTLRVCVRKGNYNAELKITLEDLLKAEERGRWWVVGSAWSGELPGEKETEGKPKTLKKIDEGFSSKLLELAKKQRMNTDTRRAIFCILMSAEDYLDGFEKILRLGLKGPPEREIMNVLLHCLLQEKEFNAYYEHLARRFCTCDRRFQVMLQFATWDKIQNLKTLTSTQVTNLAKFLGRLILEKNLPISVLKVVEFGELDKPAVRFIRQVLLAILLADSEDSMIAVFGRIANAKALKLFREGLRLFLHHFVLRNSKDVEGADMALLTTRVKLADSALSATDRNLAF